MPQDTAPPALYLPHGAVASHWLLHPVPQKSGPKPQMLSAEQQLSYQSAWRTGPWIGEALTPHRCTVLQPHRVMHHWRYVLA